MKRALAVTVCLLAAGTAGSQEATFLVRGDRLPVPVAVNGYVQDVVRIGPHTARVHVATSLAPIGAVGRYGDVLAKPSPAIPAGFRMPPELRSRLRGDREAYEVATAVLRWVAVNLHVDTDDGPQDAASVLRWRRGRCSGVANATAALLLAAGFEARTVSGLLASAEGPIAHRWVECKLPRAGWVPTDPTLGLWVVTPDHITFADTVTSLPQVIPQESMTNLLGRLPTWRNRPLRPNLGSELVCRLVGGAKTGTSVVAILYGAGGEVHRGVLGPEARFELLLPGRWRLVVMADGRMVENRALLLSSDQVYTFNVALPSPDHAGEVGL